MNEVTKNLIIGAALTGLFATGAIAENKTAPSEDSSKGECHGINSCKGTGDCGGKGHSCAGKNSCKGQGWISMTKKDCDSKKGNFKKS
ncbi:hypothetical protein ACE5IS_00625 [Leptospira wolffii]|uniref:DUF2282 domain-containing protein n=1 Tax=Leptospira wolffii TaxID=409998 RepID=A0A2M9ZG16_9LEPT|nr:integral membrane protein, PF10048 family [Leptospira wolffii]EPG65351.1 integral membrane protein, PF10048 family [Leptospira wolffii serovar Khorat str. Khorat-H2]PJZ67287.1 hypothetical protein CH371_04375 [Leptospira wolffii]TGK62279.1 hypothetical protein EHQ32_05495 [Leptospira wolffii]TGK68204.1 hypothetical protein EHQ27_14705 [Leptospira wolffii]TGK74337.1 hypothetical protein EHQ35_08280 [Leptospira wolffii]